MAYILVHNVADHGKGKIVMMVLKVVVMTSYGTVNDNKVGIVTILAL